MIAAHATVDLTALPSDVLAELGAWALQRGIETARLHWENRGDAPGCDSCDHINAWAEIAQASADAISARRV